jgi:hypothetical protein
VAPFSRRIANILPFPDYPIDEFMENAGSMVLLGVAGLIGGLVIYGVVRSATESRTTPGGDPNGAVLQDDGGG